jgi:hypothetical protein
MRIYSNIQTPIHHPFTISWKRIYPVVPTTFEEKLPKDHNKRLVGGIQPMETVTPQKNIGTPKEQGKQ